jgi:YHS domain-containing protein
MTTPRGLVAALAFVISLTPILAQDDATPERPVSTQPAKAEPGDPYTLDTCPVDGKKLEAKPIIRTHHGRELCFCSAECASNFERAPDAVIKRADEKIIDAQKPFYAAEVCPVAGEKLGSMGEPVSYVYRNRLVRFCCDMCIQEFEKSPAKYLPKLDEAAIEKQLPSYPLESCPISGKKLGSMGEPVNVVIGNRLVRLCCKGCEGALRKEPLKALAKLDEAGAKAKPAGGAKR